MFGSDYERALEACYDAVADPAGWAGALDALARSLDSAAAMFYPKDVGAQATLVPSSIAYGDFLEDYVKGQWYENHYRAERGWPLILRKPVVIEHDLATDEERRRLPHYNELYLKWGYPGFAAVSFRVDGEPWCLPLLRSFDQGMFSPEEADRLAELRPHLARMMRMAAFFDETVCRTSLDAFDHAGRPAALIDFDGRLRHANAAFDGIVLRNPDVLGVVQGRLRARRPDADIRLQRLIDTALGRAGDGMVDMRNCQTVLPRHAGPPLLVEAVWRGDLVERLSLRGKALLTVRDTAVAGALSHPPLKAAFGISRAEFALCEALLAGLTLKEAADLLGLTVGTVRQRIKAVFHKTSTARQAELMLLLSRFCDGETTPFA